MARRPTFSLLAGAILLLGGCGTLTQGYMPPGPAIFGGVRLDIDILAHERAPVGSKVMAGMDLIPSLAFDAAFLPFSLLNELIQWGIDVEAPPDWDNPPPKYAPYSAPPNAKLQDEIHPKAADLFDGEQQPGT